MAKILLAGKSLFDYMPLEVIDIASRRGHQRYPLGPCADAIRNREVLHGFGGKTERTSSELIAHMSEQHPEWSDQFCALKIGESLGWAVEMGIVERVPGGQVWRLLEPECQFEIIGGHRKERSLRVRGHVDDGEAVVAAKLWKRELGRRERARLREIAEFGPQIKMLLDAIVDRAPETKLIGRLEKYAIAGFDDAGSCQQLILDSIDSMESGEPYMTTMALKNLFATVRHLPKATVLAPADISALEGFAI
ncbi:hypothetical protein [Devosia faecipullorum]|uniref:hypothetical protein n=1 Tax=Devosia faecipullorum TaxID=2755039 RepID=UPI00187B899C|nr:hypothetical protein [Devosia faecipullorum]MBE7732147.1 hypothetical protein [Devosia faecipullorum]